MLRAHLLLPVLVLLAGCPKPPRPSADVDQDEIAQEYLAVYNARTDFLGVEAYFWAEGRKLQLSHPSRVTHSGFPLHLDGSRYVRTSEGFVDYHEWTWTDTAKRVYVNTILMSPVSFVDPPERITRSESAVFEFEPPLEDDEDVWLQDAEGSLILLFGGAADPGGMTVTLTPEEMQFIPDDYDELVLELVRTRGARLQESTSGGGSLYVESISDHITVALDP
jgi:hypothetical protein